MEVRSDLDRSVAGIQSLQFDRTPARIKINAAVARSDDTGVFRIGRRARRRADWLVDCHKLGTIGKHALDLNNIHHSGDAGQYIIGRKNSRAMSDQICNRSPFPRTLEHFSPSYDTPPAITPLHP